MSSRKNQSARRTPRSAIVSLIDDICSELAELQLASEAIEGINKVRGDTIVAAVPVMTATHIVAGKMCDGLMNAARAASLLRLDLAPRTHTRR